MTSPRSISVDMSDRNGTRWSSTNWLNADSARITEVQGMLPLNHITDKVPAHMAFAAWLDATVKPETFNWIMSNEKAFANSYAAYRNLAQFQARMKTPANNINREAKPAESTTNNV